METESFELKILDIVEETGDARSISFEVPEGQEETFVYKPGQFLTLAIPSDLTGVKMPLGGSTRIVSPGLRLSTTQLDA